MKLADPEVLIFAGGECLEKYGTLFKRLRPSGEALETVTAPSVRFARDRYGTIRRVEAGLPAVDWQDYDGTGLRPTASIERAETQLCEFSIPGGTPSDWELQELDAVTNLAGEYAVQIDPGDNLQYTLPSDFDPNSWTASAWVIPSFDYDDGERHYLFGWQIGAEFAYVEKGSANTIRASLNDTAVVAWTLPFAAGTPFFVGLRYHAGTFELYVDYDLDNVLEVTSVEGPTFSDNTYTAHVGKNLYSVTQQFEGAVNLLVTSHGRSADPIQDRFNSGAGMELDGADKWLGRHGEELVLHVGGPSDGSATQADSFTGGTELLDTTDGGRYSFDGAGDKITFSGYTDLDGAAAFTLCFELEPNDATASADLFTRGGASNLQIRLRHEAGNLICYVPTTLSDSSTWGRSNIVQTGRRMQVVLRYDGGGAANADRLKFFYRVYDPVTRRYGAWQSPSATFGGTIPATLTSPSAADLIVGADAAGTGSYFDGYLDDLRFHVGDAWNPTTDTAEAFLVHDANPAFWDHWYSFDTSAGDQIGSLNGSVTGAALVDDGRHHYGRFERYYGQGRYYFDGVDDAVDCGGFAALDGATKAAWWGVAEHYRADQNLVSRYEASNNNRAIAIGIGATDKLEARVGDPEHVSNVRTYQNSLAITQGELFRWYVRFDGAESLETDRWKIGVSIFDRETGTWGAWTTTTTPTGNGRPKYLRKTAGTVKWYIGKAQSGGFANGYFKGYIDDVRMWINQAPTETQLQACSIYDERSQMAGVSCPLPDHWWTFSESGGSTLVDRYYHNGVSGADMTAGLIDSRPSHTRADTGTQFIMDGTVDDVASGEIRNKHVAGVGPFDEGAYDLDGSSDYIDCGAFTTSDGAVELAVWGVIELDAGTGTIVGHHSTTDAQKSWRIRPVSGTTPKLNLRIATDGVGGALNYELNSVLTYGQRYAFYCRFKGDEAVDADKVQIGLAEVDDYGAIGSWTSAALGDGSTPATIRTPSAVNLTIGDEASNDNPFNGRIDDIRIAAGGSGTGPSVATLEAETLYTTAELEVAAGTWDHWFPMDGDADDRIGTLTGSVSGAELVSDGRRWTTTLLEPAATNVVTNDDISTWSVGGTPVVTGSIDDPAGGTGAYNVADDNPAAGEPVINGETFTGDGVKSLVFVVREAGSSTVTQQDLALRDSSAAAWRLYCSITAWKGGEPILSVSTGTLLGKRKLSGGWWAIYVQSTSVTAANNNQIYIYPTAGAEVGDIDVYRVNAYNNATPPISILDASEAITADDLTQPLGQTSMQTLTVWGRFVMGDTISHGIASVGGSSGRRFQIYWSSAATNLSARIHDGTNSAQAGVNFSATPRRGSLIEFRAKVDAVNVYVEVYEDGVLVGSSANSHVAQSVDISGTWNDSSFYVGDDGSNDYSTIQVLEMKAAAGDQSLATMQSLAQPDIAHYHPGDQEADLDGTISGALRKPDGRMPEGWTVSGGCEIDRARWLARKTTDRQTTATYWDAEAQLLRTAELGHLRDRDWTTANDGNEYRVTRVEPARTNDITYSEAKTAWILYQATVTDDAIHAPDGNVTADKLVEDSQTNNHYLDRTLSPTDNTVSTFSGFFKAGERSWIGLSFRQKNGNYQRAHFDLANGVWGTVDVSWSDYSATYYGNGWYRLTASLDFASGGTTARMNIHVCQGDDDRSYTGDGSSGLYFWGFQLEVDKPDATSYIRTSGGTSGRSADSGIQDVYTALPQEQTLYLRFVEGENEATATPNTRLIQLGDESANDYLYIRHDSSGRYRLIYDNGTGTPSSSNLTLNWSYGDLIELRATLSSAGVCQLHGTVNGGGETSATVGATKALPATWDDEVVSLGAKPDKTLVAAVGIIDAKIAAGTKTLAQMQALAEDDADTLYAYAPGQYTDEGTYGLRVKSAPDTLAVTGLTVTAEKWVSMHGRGRVLEPTVQLKLSSHGMGSNLGYSLSTVDTLQEDGIGARAVNSVSTQRVQIIPSAAGDEAYVDDVRVYQYATVSAATETKGSALPMLNGFGGAAGVADATIASAPSTVDPVAYDSAISNNLTRLDTGPAGTSSRSYRFGLPGQLNGLTVGEWVSMGVGVYIPWSSTAITPSSVKVAIVDSAGETVGTAASAVGSWNELYVSRQIDAGATEAYLELRVHDGEALGTADQTVFFRAPTIVARKCRPRPYCNAAEGTVAISADVVKREFLRAPFPTNGYTVYLKGIEVGSIDGGEVSETLWNLGDADNNNATPRVRLLHSSGQFQAQIADAVGNVVSVSHGLGVPTLGDLYEVAVRVFDDGSVQVLSRVNGGTSYTSSRSSALSPSNVPTALADDEVGLFGDGGDGRSGYGAALAFKLVTGTEWDLDQLAAADAVVETAA